jgi:signal transduction histidine kinase/CheY-like chemotaxis protein
MPRLDAIADPPSEDAPTEEEFRTLAAAARRVPDAQSVAEALRAQLSLLHELCNARASFVTLHDASRGLLTVVCTRGRADAKVRAYLPNEGAIGRAFSEGGVVTEPGLLAACLVRDSERVGTVCLLGHRSRPSPAAMEGLLANMGAALSVAQLREDLRQRTQALADATAKMKSFDQQRDEFLGRVSHELKTPLTTIKTYLAMLLRNRMGSVEAEQHRALAICDRNSDRLLRLIDDLLLVSRLSVAQMNLGDKPFGLKALLEECWAVQAKAAEHAQVTLVPPSGGELFVRGDREHLREGLFVILDNAIRYNVPGGQVWGRLSSQGATATVEIGDTGRGMTEERLKRLFEPFPVRSESEVPTRPPRSGSGLAQAHQLVQLHGGTLSAQSTLEKGSVFTVTLPLFAGMVGTIEVQPPATRPGEILLVEDDDDCREGVTELLEAEGMSVTAVGSAEKAIETLNRSKPALVLVDLRLRGGDGRSVVRHVRQTLALAEVPIFIMSGAVSEASGFSSEGPDRVDGFFEKPLNLPRLLSRIRAIVKRPEPTQSPK